MAETEFSICRPAQGYWCVRCCEIDRCCNMGKLSDGSRGCLGHQTIENPELPQIPSCKEFFCRPELLKNPDELAKVREKILANPPGEFKISDFVSK